MFIGEVECRMDGMITQTLAIDVMTIVPTYNRLRCHSMPGHRARVDFEGLQNRCVFRTLQMNQFEKKIFNTL